MRKVGCGMKPQYPELDKELFEWVLKQNQIGLVVKDKYLTAKALHFAAAHGYTEFRASSGYIQNFKQRHDLVTRARSTTRTLPFDARDKALEFINMVSNLIRQKDIQPENILNFDQVPS